MTLSFKKLCVHISKMHGTILDTLFPISCISCEQQDVWLCDACSNKIKIETEQVCGICEKMLTPDGLTCHKCKKGSFLDGLIVCTSYAEFPIKQAIHLFKYRFASELHEPLGNLIIKVLQKTDIPLPDLIIPVPLHKRRLRWRGFNQSELLSNHIASKLLSGVTLKIDNESLIRNRYTSPQMKIKKYSCRSSNLSNAFSVISTENIQGKTCLLVDDIATTGSTIFECAKTLKNARASQVFAVVIARQETKNNS